MSFTKQIIASGRKTIRLESESLGSLINKIDENFANLVQKIISLKGRVVVTGVGKSAIIANKIVATFNSTGTPSVFMHAGDAIHGDLGTIQPGDVVLALSKSGETAELKNLVPLLKSAGIYLATLVGNKNSYLAKIADVVIDVSVDAEACPNNLAPTTSTTAQLAMGDALAVALLEERNFSSSDFARFHPGGALGKKLYMTLGEIAQKNLKPAVTAETSLKNVILEITKNRLGATMVIGADGQIVGIITDGDIRRTIEKVHNLNNISALDVMSPEPKSMEKSALASSAVDVFKHHNITQLLITENGRYFGLVHFHDLLNEGII